MPLACDHPICSEVAANFRNLVHNRGLYATIGTYCVYPGCLREQGKIPYSLPGRQFTLRRAEVEWGLLLVLGYPLWIVTWFRGKPLRGVFRLQCDMQQQ